ncbi:MAG: bifunctional metallophosphatase/5'-nucleotidase [Muribaculaceae bacterium]|nr:bifunctional metallophosphatase/5'-nucleotidase [Muribaculaceae bacterium]
MKKSSIFSLAVVAAIYSGIAIESDARELVILHTNDTHSQIDPTDKGYGGVQRRKVFVDSVRQARPDVLLIDAGDAVQGTLFFTLYGGEVEMQVMNHLGYDLAILGNHDFDNGMEGMAGNVALSGIQWLATNYKFDDPEVASLFKPYEIYEYGDKKVGVLALNLNPEGMIADGNAAGVTYLDAIEAANATAWWLKNIAGVDLVVAVSHLGYDNVPSPSDKDIVKNSKNIDVILGGHSHTLISPDSGHEWVVNGDGEWVLVTQNAKSGEYISEVTIDLDSIGVKRPSLRQVRLGAEYDRAFDAELAQIVAPYRKGVDELMEKVIGKSARELPNDQPGLINFVSDFVDARGSQLIGRPVDLALMNVGSLRRGLPKGDITQGMIISMQPFTNKILVMELTGKDLMEAINVYASRGGDGVSSQVMATYDPETNAVVTLTVDGKPVDPNRVYTVATIDYLAGGGDYMVPLKRGHIIARSENIVYDDLIEYIRTNYSKKKINPSNINRFAPLR